MKAYVTTTKSKANNGPKKSKTKLQTKEIQTNNTKTYTNTRKMAQLKPEHDDSASSTRLVKTFWVT